MGSSLTKSVDPGDMILVETQKLAAAATTINFTGLDLDAHHFYILKIVAINNTAAWRAISIEFNGDTTATNYYSQEVAGSGTGVTAVRSNYGKVGVMTTSSISILNIEIMKNSASNCRGLSQCEVGAATLELRDYSFYYSIGGNITSVLLRADAANGFKENTQVSLYRLDT